MNEGIVLAPDINLTCHIRGITNVQPEAPKRTIPKDKTLLMSPSIGNFSLKIIKCLNPLN
jgi:hypothetical protein